MRLHNTSRYWRSGERRNGKNIEKAEPGGDNTRRGVRA